MLACEYDWLTRRLVATRGDKSAVSVFADTVATRSFKGGNACHGWIGLPFQHQPGVAPSDILLHPRCTIRVRNGSSNRWECLEST